MLNTLHSHTYNEGENEYEALFWFQLMIVALFSHLLFAIVTHYHQQRIPFKYFKNFICVFSFIDPLSLKLWFCLNELTFHT